MITPDEIPALAGIPLAAALWISLALVTLRSRKHNR